MAKAALAFAAGFGGGYLGAKRQAELDEERKQDRARIQEEHDYRKAERQRLESERIALANAAKPVQMEEGAGGMIRPETMDNRDVGLAENAQLPDQGLQRGGYRVQGQTYTDRAPAEVALAQANTPDARRLRQAQVLDQQGRPDQAITLENAVVAQRGKKQEAEDAAWRRSIGVAIQGGHDGLAELATRTETGPFAGKKAKAVPSADGKTVTYALVGEDGSLTPTKLTFPNTQEGVIMAAYQMDRAVSPKDRMEGIRKDKELERRGADSDAKHAYQVGLLDLKGKAVETQAELAQARIEAARARESRLAAGKGTGADKITREERIRYTSLLGESSRRMTEAQKALGTLQKDPLFMAQANKPGSPQAQELAELRESVKGYAEERSTYQSLLAEAGANGGAKGKEPALADAVPKGGKPKKADAPTGPVKVATKAERDKLAPGTRYIGPDGQTYVKK